MPDLKLKVSHVTDIIRQIMVCPFKLVNTCIMKWIIRKFMAKTSTLNPSFFQYICTKIGQQANPGEVSLITCIGKVTMSPDSGTAIVFIHDTPISFATRMKELVNWGPLFE